MPPAPCDPDIAHQSFDPCLSDGALADELGFDWVSVPEHHSSPLILTPLVAPGHASGPVDRRPLNHPRLHAPQPSVAPAPPVASDSG